MSERLIKILGALLVAQLLLALALIVNDQGIGATTISKPLLALDGQTVDRITLSQLNQSPLVLSRQTDKAWVVASGDNFPADTLRVEGLVERLIALKTRLVLARGSDAANRFKVAEDNYQRRVTLEGNGKTLGTLYLGNSAGARRSFVRADDQTAIYEVELGAWDLTDQASAWWNRDYLHLKETDVTRIELPGIVLERKDTSWQLADLAPEEKMAKETTQSLVQRLLSLPFLELLGTSPKLEYGLTTPTLTGLIRLQSGEERSFLLGHLTEDGATIPAGDNKGARQDSYVLKNTPGDYYFKVAGSVVNGLIVSRAQLLEAPPASPTIPPALPNLESTTTPNPETAPADPGVETAPGTEPVPMAIPPEPMSAPEATVSGE